MHWSLHTVTLESAVAEGLVEKISQQTGKPETRQHFLARLRAECIDEEQWLQEYCCIPADENAAFITHDMITACEDPSLKLPTLDQFLRSAVPADENDAGSPRRSFSEGGSALYLGVDVARKKHLCVIDLGEKIGDLTHDRLRLELLNQPFSKIKAEVFRLLALPQVRRACIDATGLGAQLAEEAQDAFGSKVEPVVFTAPLKEKLAFGLRNDFESIALRIPCDPTLRADLRGIKKAVTSAGNIRFIGETADGHCDRFWAKALRQEASRPHDEPWALVC